MNQAWIQSRARKQFLYHCIRLSFLRSHITKRSEGKIQWANTKNFIFLFLSLTYTKEERCFYRVLENNFLFLRKKIAIRLHFLKSYSFAINDSFRKVRKVPVFIRILPPQFIQHFFYCFFISFICIFSQCQLKGSDLSNF